MILVGDVGGTHTRFALFESITSRRLLYPIEYFKSKDIADFTTFVRLFLEKRKLKVKAACFGLPGLIVEGKAKLTNLNWFVDEEVLRDTCGTEYCYLINDLQAAAYGLAVLDEKELVVIQEGKAQPRGCQALISPGTGLGEAGLRWENGRYVPFPSEGAHVDFAPRNEQEIELFRYLHNLYGHVSYERVLSGPGLLNIYRFLKETQTAVDHNGLETELENSEDPPRLISLHGLQKDSMLCVKALDLFVSLLGAEAGNLALKFLASAGVYVGGGIAPHIVEKLKEPFFIESFCDKGRLSFFLKEVPLKVVLTPCLGLYGALHYIEEQMAAG